MIRIDLFRRRANQPRGADRVAEPGGASAFVSKKEVAAGVVLLLAAFALLSTQLTDPNFEEVPPQPAVAEVTAPPSETSPLPPAETLIEPDEPETAAEPDPAPSSITPPQSKTPPGATATVTKIDIDISADAVEIHIRADRELQSSWFTLPNPPRVVIDLKNADLEMQQRLKRIDHPVIHTLRFAQFQLEPMIVRLVVDVDTRPQVELSPRPDGLLIRLVPQGAEQ